MRTQNRSCTSSPCSLRTKGLYWPFVKRDTNAPSRLSSSPLVSLPTREANKRFRLPCSGVQAMITSTRSINMPLIPPMFRRSSEAQRPGSAVLTMMAVFLRRSDKARVKSTLITDPRQFVSLGVWGRATAIYHTYAWCRRTVGLIFSVCNIPCLRVAGSDSDFLTLVARVLTYNA